MKQGISRLQGILSVAGLVAVLVLTIAIISTLDRSNSGQNPDAYPGATIILSANLTATSHSGDIPYPAIESTAIVQVFPITLTDEFYAMQKADMILTATAATPEPSSTTIIIPTGTIENIYVKYTGEKLFLYALNAWHGMVDGTSVSVYSGALLEDHDQGAVVVNLTVQVLTPSRHGAVRVVSERNNRLTLVASDGTTYYFDVPARRFVDSLDEVVPTATPLPTNTPLYYSPNPYPIPK